jgi:CRP/FNR family transcriptional regulator, cyclic AMP receptor protein
MTLLLQGRSRSLCRKIGRGSRQQSSIADAPEIACNILAWKGGYALKKEFELLNKIQLFSSLNDQELRQISDKIRIKLFKKNEAILREEDTNEYMYTILSGGVKVIQISEDGRETVLAMHSAGDFFGEMSLIDGKTMPATILALEDTLTAIISKKEFSYLITQHERVLDKLLIILCSRLREAWERIQILNFNNASQRMKMLFTLLSREYGEKKADGITLNIKLTHQDIANMVGITRETVTRVLDKWQKDREVSILKNKHIHLNFDFLKGDFRWIVRK